MQVEVFVGTEKGAFVFRSDRQRKSWQIEGPLFKGWKVTAVRRVDGGFVLGTPRYGTYVVWTENGGSLDVKATHFNYFGMFFSSCHLKV